MRNKRWARNRAVTTQIIVAKNGGFRSIAVMSLSSGVADDCIPAGEMHFDSLLSRLGEGLGREANFSTAAHDETVSSFGRNDGSFFCGRENRQRQRLRFGLERTEQRRMVVTLGILRCAQNDGKDL